MLTPSDFEHANVIEMNAIGVDIDGPIQFNRIHRNTSGVQAHSSQLIAHNELSRNTVGINVQGRTDVRIFNNTVYTAAGEGINIGGASKQVEIRNNTLWTAGGYDITSLTTAPAVFQWCNNLHATGTAARLLDSRFRILDWQEDVHSSLHSIGARW
jgi:hypothetical protein